MSEPVRTCIGCRGRAPKQDLLRVVWRGQPVADPAQIRPGRGAYLHRNVDCLEQAIKRKAVVRALRLPGSRADPDAVRAALVPHLQPSR